MTALRLQQLDHLLSRCVEDERGCWEFSGRRSVDGYGRIYKPTYGENLLHRFTWIHMVGFIPTGLVLDHMCTNPPCCNPYHLRLVTQKVNMLAGSHRSAVSSRTGICVRGHDLNEAYVHPSGRLQCRKCRKVRYEQRKGIK